MSIVDKIKERAKKYKVKIVLPEYMDSRVMKAISIALREDICDIIIVGNRDDFSYVDDIILKKAEIIDPINNDLTDKLVNYLFELRKNKGMTKEEALNLYLLRWDMLMGLFLERVILLLILLDLLYKLLKLIVILN